jgi:hypothetical protein
MISFDKPSTTELGETNDTFVGGSPLPQREIPDTTPQQSPERRKKIALIAVMLLCGTGALFFLSEEEGFQTLYSLLGSEDEVAPAEALTAPQAPPHSVTVHPQRANTSEDEEEEEVDIAEDEKADERELPVVAIKGEGSQEKPWIALQKIQDWQVSGSHDRIRIKHYFGHPKAWVRLAALEVAIKQHALTEIEVESVATDMKSSFRPDQMRRWLKRVKERDVKTYQDMKTALSL